LKFTIPNTICRHEYIDEIKFLLNFQNHHKSNLNSAVAQMIAGDISFMCTFLLKHRFKYEKGNDVVHSTEAVLKGAYLMAISIAKAECEIVISEDDTPVTQVDMVIHVPENSTQIGTHIEFKNTKAVNLKNCNTSNFDRNWEKSNQYSDDICTLDIKNILLLELKDIEFDKRLNRKLLTVNDKWDSVYKQAYDNNLHLQQKYNMKFNSFAIYRVGLKCILYSNPIINNNTPLASIPLPIKLEYSSSD